MFNLYFCRRLNWNRGLLELKVTALPTAPKPLIMVICWIFSDILGTILLSWSKECSSISQHEADQQRGKYCRNLQLGLHEVRASARGRRGQAGGRAEHHRDDGGRDQDSSEERERLFLDGRRREDWCGASWRMGQFDKKIPRHLISTVLSIEVLYRTTFTIFHKLKRYSEVFHLKVNIFYNFQSSLFWREKI